MRRIFRLLSCTVWLVGWSVRLLGGEYHLTNGDIIKGEPVSFTEEGAAFKLDIGGYSPRTGWTKFTQESLKELAKNPAAAKLAEPFIEIPQEVRQKERRRREIKVNPIENRLPHYSNVGFAEAWTSPAAILILLVLFGANLYAAYEVALFRGRSAAVVCGVSAVVPVLGPLLFLCLPAAEERSQEAPATDATDAPMALPQGTRPPEMPASSGLGIAKAAHAESAANTVEPAAYKRGDFTFNRRFVETKFASFFRLVTGDSATLVIRTNKSEFIAKRISRIATNEMHVQLLRGGAEQMIAFADILEFQIRKDLKA